MAKSGRGLSYLSSLHEWTGTGRFTRDNIQRVLAALDNPQDQIKSIHVGGTNGKGSVCTYLASMLGACGYSVGLTTSPHLVKINERIVVDGLPIADQDLDLVAAEIADVSEAYKVELSFFEAITACAFTHFKWRKLDWIVVEVGLGGRLDATNLIARPQAAVVVSVDFDHEHILGNTLSLIAREKGGIFKQECIAVIAEQKAEPRETLLQVAQEVGAFICTIEEIDFKEVRKVEAEITLAGSYRLQNAACANRVGRLLGIPIAQRELGIKNAKWPGRLETIRYKNRTFWLDAAHNLAGVTALIEALKASKILEFDVIFGAINTKNWSAMVEKLIPHSNNWCILEPNFAKAVSGTEITTWLRRKGSNANNYVTDYQGAINYLATGEADIPVVVCGSIYMLGPVRDLLTGTFPQLWIKTNNINMLESHNVTQ